MLFKKRQKKISTATLTDLKQYIDRHYPEESLRDTPASAQEAVYDHPPMSMPAQQPMPPSSAGSFGMRKQKAPQKTADACCAPVYAAPSLSDALSRMDESFSDTLLRKIDERQMTDAQCYKKAQIDRKLFSKIRSQRDYRPAKATALSFALALELNLDETRDLLMKAGYALSHSSKADIIVEYCILHGIYDKFLVNEALYEFDQPLI